MSKIPSLLSFSLFFLVSFSILFGGNYFFYRSVVKFFKIENPVTKKYLFAAVVILSVSFIAAEILGRWGESGLVRIFYFGANFWLGLLVNLLLAVFLIWLIKKLLHLFSSNFNLIWIAAVFFIFAIGFSIYGCWNAFNPRLKNLNLTIKNLPAFWQGKTVIQLSDLHLGNVHRAGFLKKVVEKTNGQNPDLILITGDLFDGMDGDLAKFIEPLNELRAKEGIFFVSGNHETYLGLEKALAVLAKTNIQVLQNQTAQINGLQIVGLSYSNFANTKDSVGKLILEQANYKKELPSILLYHVPADVAQAKAVGIDLQLSGHTHHGQIFPVHFFEWLIYKKYYYGLYQDGDFSFYASSGVGSWGPPMRTGNVPEIVAITLN